MKYVRHYKQKTIKSDDPKEFDDLMNAIFISAAQGGKEPEVHFFEGMGLCASVRYFVSLSIPETISEQHEVLGERHQCSECPLFSMTPGKKKHGACVKGATWSDSPVCDEFYKGELYGNQIEDSEK